MKPLNSALYRALKARFGKVKISNQGIAQIARYKPSLQGDAWSLDVVESGEYYQVNCPFCADSRFRLYINHRWGVRDDRGRRNLWLAICYNENCLSKPGRCEWLFTELTERSRTDLSQTKIDKGQSGVSKQTAITWPGPVTRVDRLPADHKAIGYLLSRGFDPQRIGRFYGVCYCHDSVYKLVRDRLIIPVYDKGILRGWQARYIGEADWKRIPKYYTCPGMSRRHLIYNLDNAVRYRTGVIVEGPTDVWRFGPMACCVFGATMTTQQQRRFYTLFKDHSAVLLFDEDAWNKPSTQKLIHTFQGQFVGGFVAVRLPKGCDPGDMRRSVVRRYVVGQARRQGIDISWEKR